MVPRGRPMGRRWPRSSTDCWQYGRSRAMDRRSDRRGRCRRIAPVRRRGPPSQMTLTPTIGIQGGFRLQTLRDASWIDDRRIQTLYPPSVPARWRAQTRTAPIAMLEDAERLVKPQEKTVYEVVKGGGRVTAGTDAPINPYGLSLLMELENYASRSEEHTSELQ